MSPSSVSLELAMEVLWHTELLTCIHTPFTNSWSRVPPSIWPLKQMRQWWQGSRQKTWQKFCSHMMLKVWEGQAYWLSTNSHSLGSLHSCAMTSLMWVFLWFWCSFRQRKEKKVRRLEFYHFVFKLVWFHNGHHNNQRDLEQYGLLSEVNTLNMFRHGWLKICHAPRYPHWLGGP